MAKYYNFILRFSFAFILFYLFLCFILSIIDIIYYNNINIISLMVENSNITAPPISDPVRWWPSGTAQSWGIIGAALAAYRTMPGDSKKKAIAAFATVGVTVPMAVFSMAVENPNGFNRLMYSWIEYKRTGSWPGNIPNEVSLSSVENKFETESATAKPLLNIIIKINFEAAPIMMASP